MRDLRNIRCNRNNYPDLCYFYGSEAVDNNKLVKDAKPLGRFYKRDIVAFQYERKNDEIVMSIDRYVGTVQTCDIADIKPDMFVVDQTGTLFIVEAPVICDDANTGKMLGTRPSIVRTFKLRGVAK